MRFTARRLVGAALLVLFLVGGAPAAEESFDQYLNPALHRAPGSGCVRELKQLTQDQIGEFDRVLPDASGAFVLVKTNENRNAKLLLLVGRQKVAGTDRTVPMLLIERFVTYREG